MQQQGLTVHEVTKRTGLSRKALRLYEERGLVIPGRTDAGYRVYDGADLGRLELIRRARTLEMSTSDLQQFLDIAGGCCDRNLDELVALVEDKRHETEQRLVELRQLRDTLDAALATLRRDVAGVRHGAPRCTDLLCLCTTRREEVNDMTNTTDTGVEDTAAPARAGGCDCGCDCCGAAPAAEQRDTERAAQEGCSCGCR